MTTIATNNTAISALNYLNQNSAAQSNDLSQLASGSRITSAKDDASGLAVATGMASDASVLQQGATNLQNGTAVLNTGEIRYTAPDGIPALKKAIIRYTEEHYNKILLADNVIASGGAKQALMVLLHAILDPKEEVIFPAPYWVSYPEMVKLERVMGLDDREELYGLIDEHFAKTGSPRARMILDNWDSYRASFWKVVPHAPPPPPPAPTESAAAGQPAEADLAERA